MNPIFRYFLVFVAVFFAGCHQGRKLVSTEQTDGAEQEQTSRFTNIQFAEIAFVLSGVFWNEIFSGTNPKFVLYPYPNTNIMFTLPPVGIKSDKKIPHNATILGVYHKDSDWKIFVEQIAQIWCDNPGKYVNGFAEAIDDSSTKVGYILSDTRL